MIELHALMSAVHSTAGDDKQTSSQKRNLYVAQVVIVVLELIFSVCCFYLSP